MDPGDGPDAASLIRKHCPVSEELTRSLSSLLEQLLADEVLNGVIVEYVFDNGAPSSMAAFGLSGFVHGELADNYLAQPSPHLALTLLHAALPGPAAPVFLGFDQIARGNATEGLTLVPLFWLQESYDPSDPETHVLLAHALQLFFQRHRGYRLSRIMKDVPAHLSSVHLDVGFREHWRFEEGMPLSFCPEATLQSDHFVYVATKAESDGAWPGKAIGHLFAYLPPRCGFTRHEQQVLARAADGLTDAQIAKHLGITVAAVSLRWRSIYNRVAGRAPSVLGLGDSSSGVRGQEKRRQVVAFVSEHPEELRPHAGFGRKRAGAQG
jgi:DNA-binding CsgD family transcriptional regulator